MRHFLSLTIAFLLVGCGGSSTMPGPGNAPKVGGDELRNGGDPLPKLFEKGRAKARRILEAVASLQAADFPDAKSASAKKLIAFYAANNVGLADDVRETPEYIWSPSNANGACGATGTFLRAPVKLSYTDCRLIETETDAAIHIAGESAHHLGIESDSESALFAVALLKAWNRHLGLSADAIGRRLLFEEGRAYAVSVLSRLRLAEIESNARLTPDERTFLSSASDSLAELIAADQHVWVDELAGGACAMKGSTTEELKLSHSACGDAIHTRIQAAKMIVAAEISVFRKVGLAASLRLSEAVFAEWLESGHLEAPHLAQFDFPEIKLDFASLYAPVVWTGKEILTWGENSAGKTSVAALDPRMNTWSSKKDQKSPSQWFNNPNEYATTEHAIATVSGQVALFTPCAKDLRKTGIGHIYNVRTQSWINVEAPEGWGSRRNFRILEAGDKIALWGGDECGKRTSYDDGYLFDPLYETWTHIPSLPRFGPRKEFSITWTPGQLILWGGCLGDETKCFNDGAIYSFGKETWSEMSTEGAPSPRMDHKAVWADDTLVVFGGRVSGDWYLDSGARYNAADNRWKPMSMKNGPRANPPDALFARPNIVAVSGKIRLYHPVRDEWTTLERMPTPPYRKLFWTGAEVVFWNGGFNYAFYP